ncbi:hypothetical protein SAMN02745945_00993 [Peptoclostridium litorale DSM 5388]|uniref:DUF2194 domain-containing protein n=1 Tax=Peptoclostridium litorale DSM 5388 TaxID=1121324 RepID=A0A069RAG2_PEPLI|nr:DUF2194 domain-containing protein [Peptoclostridium litorale]KDR93798.1 hypothetical protein CLIT_23c00700 [Peptoclostridium litorale DSM 5388]SIN86057.1 hypothetical protein SAMN02745945_00993 [Peptoclostridium litorale DSM 5388]
MINKKVFIYVLAIILISAAFIQVARTGTLEQEFSINQESVKTALKTTASENIPKDCQKVIALYSKDYKGSKDLRDNMEKILEMARLNFEMVDIDSEGVLDNVNGAGKDDIIVVGTEKFGNVKYNDLHNALISKVESGTSAVFMVRSYQPGLDKLCGIVKNGGYMGETVFGIEFHQKFFPGLDEISMGKDDRKIAHSSLDVKLGVGAKLIASAQGTPVLWTNDYGSGRVVYVNSTLLMDKANRGIMTQSIALSNDRFIYTIFNGKIVNIDDFPAPVKPGTDDVIYENYHMNNNMFYRNIWWSSLYNMSKKYHMKYTGLVTGVYNLETKSPLPNIDAEGAQDIKYFGRKLSEIGGELGIHGYNHNSLALNGQMEFGKYGYSPWESKDAMEEGLLKLKESLEAMYGRDINIYTYVPPSNIISKDGKDAVKNVFPEIKVFAGLYTGMPENGMLYQEFGKDPDIEGAYDLPRISSGYEYNKYVMWDIYSGIAHYGIVNHFIHPDDILDAERSSDRSWEELERDIDSIFGDIYRRFPYLRGMTSRQAVEEYIKNENLNVYVEYGSDYIRISHENMSPPAYHVLKVKNGKISSIDGGKYSILDIERGLYVVEATSADVNIKIGYENR